MRCKDIVIFNEDHEYYGNIGVVRKIKGTDITVGVLIPPTEILIVNCKNTDLINTKRKYPYTIEIQR